MKVCTRCGKLLDESQFSKEKRTKDGLRRQCKSCDKEYAWAYYHNADSIGRLLHRMRNTKVRAKNKGISFTIDYHEYIGWFRLQPKNCYYCGSPLTNGKHTKHKLTDMTLDRKNPNQGYSLQNIVLCCRRCNMIKGNWFTEQQMLEIANKYLRSSNHILIRLR